MCSARNGELFFRIARVRPGWPVGCFCSWGGTIEALSETGPDGSVHAMKRQDERESVESAVSRRYAAAAQAVEPSLCCAVDYDPALLEVIPTEVIERDYGCGDPSRHVREGEVVLDLGSGSGKTCFISSQVVGDSGKVLGVDANDEMLGLARGAQSVVSAAIGYDNIQFLKGRIQDLALDLERLQGWLVENPINHLDDWQRAEEIIRGWRSDDPLVASESVDIVVSNCVLNLVHPDDRRSLFAELGRVLKKGGRAVISDIVASADVPKHLQQDLSLWSGCVSGAFREDRFCEAFSAAGLVQVEVLHRQEEPWTVVEGIEFRSVTVRAYRPQDSGDGLVPAPDGFTILGTDPASCCQPGGECC